MSRRAVLRLLNDGEWSQWSDREIARRCAVGKSFVGNLRASLATVDSERTYTTKHGTPAVMKTANIGRVGGTTGGSAVPPFLDRRGGPGKLLGVLCSPPFLGVGFVRFAMSGQVARAAPDLAPRHRLSREFGPSSRARWTVHLVRFDILRPNAAAPMNVPRRGAGQCERVDNFSAPLFPRSAAYPVARWGTMTWSL